MKDTYNFTEALTTDNARRYADTIDKLCFCADLSGCSVDSVITAKLENKLEALAISSGYLKHANINNNLE